MHLTSIARILLPAGLLLAGLQGTAQDAQSVQAKKFMIRRQLLQLQAVAPYYLTAKDRAQLQLLQGRTQAQVCQGASPATCQPVILPVTGLQLAGQRTNAEKVQLNWETIAEHNSKGFVLERQSFYNALQFDSLVFVPGTGTSYSKKKYSYNDFNPYDGKSFYRVKQLDVDGKATYSNVVMVEGSSGKFGVNVIPNPAIGHYVRVYFSGLTANQEVSLTVSSSIGKQLIRKEKFKPGNGYIELSNLLFSAGYYFVTVYTNGAVYTKSFSVVD